MVDDKRSELGCVNQLGKFVLLDCSLTHVCGRGILTRLLFDGFNTLQGNNRAPRVKQEEDFVALLTSQALLGIRNKFIDLVDEL